MRLYRTCIALREACGRQTRFDVLHTVQYKCIASSSKTVKTESAAHRRFIDMVGAGLAVAAVAPYADMKDANANLVEAIISAERTELPDGADFHVRMQHAQCAVQ